jgi:hypothetical protein
MKFVHRLERKFYFRKTSALNWKGFLSFRTIWLEKTFCSCNFNPWCSQIVIFGSDKVREGTRKRRLILVLGVAWHSPPHCTQKLQSPYIYPDVGNWDGTILVSEEHASQSNSGKASIGRRFEAVLQKWGIVYLSYWGQWSKWNKELRNVFFQSRSTSWIHIFSRNSHAWNDVPEIEMVHQVMTGKQTTIPSYSTTPETQEVQETAPTARRSWQLSTPFPLHHRQRKEKR